MTLRHTTLGRTPLDEWSGRRRDHIPDNTQHPQQTDILPRRDSKQESHQARVPDPSFRPR